MIKGLRDALIAIQLCTDPNDVAELSVTLYFELDNLSNEIDKLKADLKAQLTEFMGEMGTLGVITPVGTAKYSKPSVITRLDGEAIKKRRAEDLVFDAMMKQYDKITEQAGSLRFTKPKERTNHAE